MTTLDVSKEAHACAHNYSTSTSIWVMGRVNGQGECSGYGQAPSWSNKNADGMNHVLKCQVRVLCIVKFSVIITIPQHSSGQ